MFQPNVWKQIIFATNCTYFVCQISTELRPCSHAGCSIEFVSIVHLYGTSCRNMRNNKNKHSGGVSCNACSAFIKYKYFILNTWNEHQMRRKFFLGLKLLNPANDVLRIQSLKTCTCKFPIQNNFWYKHFICRPSFKSFAHILRQIQDSVRKWFPFTFIIFLNKTKNAVLRYFLKMLLAYRLQALTVATAWVIRTRLQERYTRYNSLGE